MPSRLVELVQAVLDGNIGAPEALGRLKQAIQRTGGPDAAAEDEALADPATIAREVRALLDRLNAEPSHLRVRDGGQAVVDAVQVLLGPGLAAKASLEVGYRLIQLDRPSFALEPLTAAESGLREAGDGMTPLASELRMRALSDTNDWSTLLDAATAALAVLSDGRFGAMALQRQAEALLRLGRQDEARPVIERAIDEFDRAPKDHQTGVDQIELLKFKGEIARSQGDFEAALASYERARDAALRLQKPRAAAFMLSEIGITWERAGDLARGAEVLERARGEAARLGDWRSVLRWGGTVAAEKVPVESLTGSNLFAYAARQMLEPKADYEKIRDLALRCIEEGRSLKLVEFEAQARNLLSATYEGLGRPNQAIAAVGVAVDLAHAIENPSLELTFRTNRTRLWIVQERFTNAQEELPAIFALADQLLDDTSSSELRQTIRVMLARACEYGVLCASLQWTKTDGSHSHPPDADAWIAISQRGQAHNLTSWIALANRAERLRDTPFADAVRRARAADVTLERLAIGGGVLTQAVTAQQEALGRLRAAAMAVREPVTSRAPQLTRAEIEAAAPANATVLALYPLKDSVTFSAFSAGAPAACGRIPWTEAQRERWLVRWDLAHAAARAALLPDDDQTRGWRLVADLSATGAIPPEPGHPPEPLERLLREFQARLLDPLRDRLGTAHTARHLIVVPHVDLSMLPFWRWSALDPHVRVSLTPSLGCLTLLKARDRPLTGDRVKCGDATGTLRMVARELASLPHHRAIPPDLATVAGELSAASVVHFAGHGYFNRPRPYDSGLVLRAPEAPAPFVPDPWHGGHAMLTVSGIVSDVVLPRCYLTTLSACCTGVPRRHAASEFTSLPAALLVAGARNVIASLWPAHDGAAALLMEELYRDLPAGPAAWSPSAALARARHALAAISRADAVARLGSEDHVPPGERPFASPLFTMTFQHYGVD